MRIALFAAMAAFLIAAISVPDAFGDLATEFAFAYGAVRIGQIVLFLIASRDDPDLRHSVWTLAGSTAIGISFSSGDPCSIPGRRRPFGDSPWHSTWAGRTSSDRRAGSLSPAISPRGTA